MEDNLTNEKNSDEFKLKDSITLLLGVVIFMTINNLIYNVLFIILGSAADLKGYSLQQIGLLGSVYLSGQVIANFSSIFWVRRFNWKYTIACSTIVSIVSLYLASFADYSLFLILLTITGLASGTALACVMCCISGMKNPTKAYSLGIILQMIVAGSVTYLLQVYITPSFSYEGLLYCIAALFFCTLPFVMVMPNTDSRKKTDEPCAEGTVKNNPSISISSLIALFGIAFFFMSQTGIWGFLERIAAIKNMDKDFIGITLGTVLILCSLGAAIAIKVGKRFGILKPMFIGILFSILALFLWYISDNKWVYSLAALIFASAWNFCLPYQLLAVSQKDKDGRYAAMIPAFQSVGGAMGPVMVGLIVINDNYDYVYLMALITTLISFVMFWLVNKKHKSNALKLNPLKQHIAEPL